MPRRTDPADEIEQIFRGRNNRARQNQGAIVTQLAARKEARKRRGSGAGVGGGQAAAGLDWLSANIAGG